MDRSRESSSSSGSWQRIVRVLLLAVTGGFVVVVTLFLQWSGYGALVSTMVAVVLIATVTILRDQGRFAEALPLLDRLIQQQPGNRELLQFREALSRAAASG